MSTLDIRGQEVTLQIVVDGDHKRGSFLKVESFKLNPDSQIVKRQYLGSPYAQGDLQVDGTDFSFTTPEADGSAMKLWIDISKRAAAGDPFPQIDVVVIKKYRDPGTADQAFTLSGAILKLDDQESGGRKEYMKNSWTGFIGGIPDEV